MPTRTRPARLTRLHVDEKLEAFRSVRDAIEKRIRDWLETSPT